MPACVLLALLSARAQAASQSAGFFKTPSGNIVCRYGYGARIPSPLLECGIASGLRPAPPRSGRACKVLDYTPDRVALAPAGRPQPIACSGDAGPFADPAAARTLPYGAVWRGGGYSCSSARTGLTCRNAAGHGFFLSRASWHAF